MTERPIPPGAALDPGALGGRHAALDAARGVAVIAMVIYHFAWDLSFLRLIATDILAVPAWQLFARAIAASFLAIVGLSLVLAPRGRGGWSGFLRRLALVAGSALAISVATYVAFPESFIFFGILHCIAASSVLALPFLRLPIALVILAALAAFAAPLVLTSNAFDAPYLEWLGLGQRTPLTNDYVPIFPWFGFVLAGVAAGRLGLALALARSSPPGRPLMPAKAGNQTIGWLGPGFRRGERMMSIGALAWLGRRSLVIYLVHQPVLLALLSAASWAFGPNIEAQRAPFLRRCEAACVARAVEPIVCNVACGCLPSALEREDLWRGTLADRLGSKEQARMSEIAAQCLADTRAQRRP